METPEETVNEASRKKVTDSRQSLIILLLIAGLVASLLSYVSVQQQLRALERSVTALETTLPQLPQATIDAIIALQNGEQSNASVPQTASGPIVTSIDDDAFVGDKKAQLAIIEFSDFNCPFCSRFHAETLEPIIDSYVQTGQAIYVYRDFVGVGGNVTLTAAGAAECVREYAGDSAYLELVEQVYQSSGTKNVATVKDLAARLDLESDLETCISEDRYRQEVIDDTRAAQAAGARGTPAFVIGRLAEDGSVTGVSLAGAQPFEVFQRVIDEQLAKLE